MLRTTISLHESAFRKAKKIAHDEHVSLGEAITELLNLGFKCKGKLNNQNPKSFSLRTFSLGTPKIPLEDKEALLPVTEKKLL